MRLVFKRCTFARFEFKPQDMWIGAFWKNSIITEGPDGKFVAFDLWICVLPMVPFHLQIVRGYSSVVLEVTP